ncbi:hypothetical protein [Rubrobacter calidifluminis]|uniref:hypothetical protein n=1 Tax=Rubrobacter calidifluminis TaxID=1392640 RepID=UPI00235FCFBB|nr:hypothetical protein [Rubrobacter calidifluminis]
MITELRERTRIRVGRHPSLFFAIYGVRSGYREMLVSRQTRLVIEGFPRSGNTFAVFAFRQAQEVPVRIAHHLHAPAQVIRASRLGIPALVLIRNPMDAVVSLMLREPRFSAGMALSYYISFYEAVAGFRDSYVLGTFEEVTRDYGSVIERVNDRFDTSFGVFEHTGETVKDVFARIEEAHRAKRNSVLVEEKVARPSATKAGLKAGLRKELARDPALEPLVERARAVYGELVSGRTVPAL